jgi:hypothetical protein
VKCLHLGLELLGTCHLAGQVRGCPSSIHD